MITQERLRELLDYDPNTGNLTWRENRRGTIKAGHLAGGVQRCGRRFIRIDRKRYPAEKLAWLHVFGRYPEESIIHINGIRHDNRVPNLRLKEKGDPTRVDNTSGCPGVSWHKRHKKWQVQIHRDGIQSALGYYKDLDEAIAVRRSFI